jgi:hypothetical protein
MTIGDSDTAMTDSPKLVDELRKATLAAVKTLGEVCSGDGIPVETQVLAAKTLLEFKPETVRLGTLR